MHLIPDHLKNEIHLHLKKIREVMIQNDVDALLIGSNANIYYTSGRFFRGYVYITSEGAALWFVIKPTVYDNTEDVFLIRKPEDIPGILIDRNYSLPKNIALEQDDLTFSQIIRLRNLFPEAEYGNGSLVLKRARMTKTPWEIEEMKYDGIHQTKVYGEIKDCYRPGMTDLEFQIEIEKHLRLEGSLGVSRVSGNLMEINLGSVISGENADNPGPYDFTMGGAGVDPSLPVGADNTVIRQGETVMIDMNGAFNGYQTDMTRVWCCGDISSLAEKAHECSIRIMRCLEKNSIPGLPVKDMYEMAISIVKEEGLQDYFMGHRSQVGFIGHGVGIELNELPVIMAKSKDILEENMTLAIEPKFVIPHVGAVGIENTYVVRKDGLENITVFPEEIEKL